MKGKAKLKKYLGWSTETKRRVQRKSTEKNRKAVMTCGRYRMRFDLSLNRVPEKENRIMENRKYVTRKWL